MIRVCFTIIAYIISFLSHSNEMASPDGQRVFSEHKSQNQPIVRIDSIREESELYMNDLK